MHQVDIIIVVKGITINMIKMFFSNILVVQKNKQQFEKLAAME